MSVVVDKTFEQVLQRLVSHAGAASSQMLASGDVPWCGLAENNEIIDGFDHDAISTVFSRAGTAKIYADALTPNTGSYRDAQAAKVQGDVLSALERDTRMRHRSRVRMMAHGLSRQVTHGLGAGPISGNILQYAKLLIDSGPADA